jgi:hypothetical protein
VLFSCFSFDRRGEGGLGTYFECLQIELEERLVDGCEVLLDAGLAEAVCDAADEAPVFDERLEIISNEFSE